MNDLISVIIPAYNAEKTIRQCLDSVLKQTYSNIECIVINDGSVDQTEKIVLQLSEVDSRIKLNSQENQGVSAARNQGMQIANGDYIMFVDADDLIAPTYCDDLYQLVIRNSADCCGGSFIDAQWDEDYQGYTVLHRNCPTTHDQIQDQNGEKALIGDEGVDLYFASNLFTSVVWGKIFSATSLKGCQFRSRKYGEDSLFMFEYFIKNLGVVVLSSAFDGYYYMQHAGSVMRQLNQDDSPKYKRQQIIDTCNNHCDMAVICTNRSDWCRACSDHIIRWFYIFWLEYCTELCGIDDNEVWNSVLQMLSKARFPMLCKGSIKWRVVSSIVKLTKKKNIWLKRTIQKIHKMMELMHDKI